MGRCTGHCCAAFSLPELIFRKDLRKFIAFWSCLDYMPDEVDQIRLTGQYPHISVVGTSMYDLAMIIDMIMPLDLNDPPSLFTCRHFNGRNCTIYDDRPVMCSKYGTSESPCDHYACENSDAVKCQSSTRIEDPFEV